MESSRDSGCRQELGRLVQFCACRKPTITICRVMLLSLCRPDAKSIEVKRGGQFVFARERTQLVPGRVLDVDAGGSTLLLAKIFDLAGIEHPGRAFGRWRRL